VSTLIMKLRKNIIWIALVAIALIFYSVFANKSAVENSVQEQVISDAEMPSNSGAQKTVQVPPENPSENIVNPFRVTAVEWQPGDKAQLEQLLRWKADRGWFDLLSEDFNGAPDYRNYPKDVLEKLASEGDLRALHTLARKPMRTVERRGILTKAATYGSTFALIQIANGITTQKDFMPNPTEENKRLAIMDALAYVEVVKMRGEIIASKENAITIRDVYHFVPTEGERQLIQEKAQVIYNDLNSKRKELGLDEFDNSVPPIVEAHQRFHEQH
jgi:hypothetical protein